MSLRITERSLYKPIGDVLRKHGVKSVQEVSISGEKFPDLLAEIDGYKFLIMVKIDSESKLLEDIASGYVEAMKINAQGVISTLFPSEVRNIHPDTLDSVAPKLEVARAIVALPWVADSWRKVCLEDFARRLEESYKFYIETKYPSVSYDVIVSAAREAVIEIASAIRQSLISQYASDAMAIVGRFDLYRAALKDFGVKEEEMKAWIADIAAYITVNQLLFYHILSQKTGRYSLFPDVNPFMPDKDLIDKLRGLFSKASKDYKPVFGPDLLSIIGKAGGLNSLHALSRYIAALKALKPEHIKGELLGRLYQESIPPEARKNLGAFFTKPKAATILATMAIDKWDEKVLDPACGSGTLLTEVYKRKKKLAPVRLSDEEMHQGLLSDIYGIDIMHFAHNMTSINLLAQNLTVPAELKNIKAGDGLEPMIISISCEEDPPAMRLIDWIERVRPERLPHENFDVVIMNPPFTRRERLSEVGELDRLERLFRDAFEGEVVRGKVGYWAYFMAAVDNMIKPDGKLAMVTPEEFFAGGSAESLRRFLFFGETFKERKYMPTKKSPRRYKIDYVVRSGKEVAFSEAALYRDYLVVFRKTKGKAKKPVSFIILKKPLDEIIEEEVATEIRNFATSRLGEISIDDFEAIKIYNADLFLEKHIDNLKPLVGFNTLEAQQLFLELIDVLSKHPTLGDLDTQGLLKIQVYNPGQYATKGVEDEARKLFIKRYKGRGKALFEYVDKEETKLKLLPIGLKDQFEINISDTVPTLRTYAGVRKINISDEEEGAIVNPKNVPSRIRRASGMLNMRYYGRAASDIKSAYEHLSGEILLSRKIRLTSPNFYWLAYYTKNKALGITSALLNAVAPHFPFNKEITIYLNSSISLLQLLGFAVETEGAFVTLHDDQVWKHIHVPAFDDITEDVRNEVLRLFDRIAKLEAESLFSRFKNKSSIQKEIDEVSLEMLGLGNWKDRLDDVYSAIIGELKVMQEILERRKKPSKRKIKHKKSQEEKIKQVPLDSFQK